jgi:hypothetical protein
MCGRTMQAENCRMVAALLTSAVPSGQISASSRFSSIELNRSPAGKKQQ